MKSARIRVTKELVLQGLYLDEKTHDIIEAKANNWEGVIEFIISSESDKDDIPDRLEGQEIPLAIMECSIVHTPKSEFSARIIPMK